MPPETVGVEQYKRRRRDALDRLVDRELRREARCERMHKALGKVGLAIVVGAVPPLFVIIAGWFDKVSSFLWAVVHGGPPR